MPNSGSGPSATNGRERRLGNGRHTPARSGSVRTPENVGGGRMVDSSSAAERIRPWRAPTLFDLVPQLIGNRPSGPTRARASSLPQPEGRRQSVSEARSCCGYTPVDCRRTGPLSGGASGGTAPDHLERSRDPIRSRPGAVDVTLYFTEGVMNGGLTTLTGRRRPRTSTSSGVSTSMVAVVSNSARAIPTFLVGEKVPLVVRPTSVSPE